MQTLICLPEFPDGCDPMMWNAVLLRKIAGVPLLPRVIMTAVRSGATSVLVVHPKNLPASWLRATLQSKLASSAVGIVQLVELEEAFDPEERTDWERLAHRLEPRFLWLPWNYVTVKPALAFLLAAAQETQRGAVFIESQGPAASTAMVVSWKDVYEAGSLGRYVEAKHLESVSSAAIPGIVGVDETPGILVDSEASGRRAETLLVRGSGKHSDGIHSKLNRWLSRGMVRWLLKTPVTANMVTWAGLPVVVASGYFYAQGNRGGYALGGLLYLFSVLLDEVDGMIARTKFQESAFGCWLETFMDYSSYLVLWLGFSIGLYREFGSPWWPALGALVITVNVWIFFILVQQRKDVVPSDHPEAYQKRFYGRLEADSTNRISWMIRKVVHLAKRGVMAHYLLLFSLFGAVSVLFGFVVAGVVLTLLISIYMNRLFRLPILGQAANVRGRLTEEMPS